MTTTEEPRAKIPRTINGSKEPEESLSKKSRQESIDMHTKCRSASSVAYSTFENVRRFSIPDDKVSWSAKFKEYRPTSFTTPFILDSKPAWADPDFDDDAFKSIKFNELDGKVDRRSLQVDKYEIVDSLPLNPCGRTGLKMRGTLGKWGPNHAADPIVTRWKKSDGKLVLEDGKRVLQFIAITRGDTGEMALPGGMRDPGEEISLTLRREFQEEAMNVQDRNEDSDKYVQNLFDNILKKTVIYTGYVDDPRNTDNAWMETTAVNFHAEGDELDQINLQAGDDAKAVHWADYSPGMSLYASHKQFIDKTVALHQTN